ncbi:MAG: hydantoinase/oxoprolinase family protein [Chloroflexi bacterium]|nr:hydantoinase/oxoprolinase family protein [Chloroflexota bacterium]
MDVIGVDVGGTFTDLIRFDEAAGRITATKVASTPRNPARAILAGLVALGLDPAAVRHLIHGTTVATNTILERKGARVGLVTTEGFRDVLEIGRTQRMVEGSMFNPRFVRPAPLVPRPLRFEVRERLLHDGSVLEPLDEDNLATVAAQLREAGVEAVAVCFLHSYRNPAHEQRAGGALCAALPEAFVSLSSEVVPEYREYERFSTTVLNAFVSPVVQRYLATLDGELADRGYTAPVFTMASNGGIMTSEQAGRLAVSTVLSGPVGGVNGAIAVARAAGARHLITYDMGGTSTDVCLVHDLAPAVTTLNLVAGFPLKVPQVEINTVGAGGGSIAWLDGAELQVGPRSAGADPGPVCYGLGGTEPTVTDANLVLGRIAPDRLLGGVLRLRPALATESLRALAQRLGGLDPHYLADGIVRLTVARMTSSIREISVERGYDPRDFVLVAFGGAGPMHATQVAQELGTARILIPRYPGNLSALGLLTSDLRYDYVRAYLETLNALRPDDLAARFAELEAPGRRQLLAGGVAQEDVYLARSLDLRYLGQGFELNVALPEVGCDPEAIRQAFHARYLATYGRSSPEEEVQVVNLRLAAFGRVPKPPFQPLAADGRARVARLDGACLGLRPVYFGGRFWDTPTYERDLLPGGARLEGPAIVEETGATTVVAPGWRGEVDEFGNLALTVDS